MKRYIKSILSATVLALSLGATSCTGDLDVTPIDPNLVTSDGQAGENISVADALFNKCYATIALAGNGGPDGDSDVDGIDGGTSGYVRQMWNANELTTDEAICAWGDDGISGFNFNTFDASHPMLAGFYYRLYTAITYCNQYLSEYGEADATRAAEVRFLRAMHYYFLLDCFGNVPFATSISSAKPKQILRPDLYQWVKNELLEIEPALSEAKAKKSTDANYGRVDKAADWLLLSRLFLNAKVYKGATSFATTDLDSCKLYAGKVINSSYKLNTTKAGKWSAYQMLFMGDNGETDAAYEAVFPLYQDGVTTASYGTSLYVIAGSFDGDMHADPDNAEATNGLTGKTWAGNRARPDLVRKFFPNDDAPEATWSTLVARAEDNRALFDSKGRSLDNTTAKEFTNGYGVVKWTNFYSTGAASHNSDFPDTDYFLMRAAEAYLNYAEADARANGGSTTATGTKYVNALRTRAGAETKTAYSLSDLCDEWSREFFWEGRRRTDLVRFDRFGGNVNYNWQWKGGVQAGRNFDAFRNIFALPTNDLEANDNLVQNNGYK